MQCLFLRNFVFTRITRGDSIDAQRRHNPEIIRPCCRWREFVEEKGEIMRVGKIYFFEDKISFQAFLGALLRMIGDQLVGNSALQLEGKARQSQIIISVPQPFS